MTVEFEDVELQEFDRSARASTLPTGKGASVNLFVVLFPLVERQPPSPPFVSLTSASHCSGIGTLARPPSREESAPATCPRPLLPMPPFALLGEISARFGEPPVGTGTAAFELAEELPARPLAYIAMAPWPSSRAPPVRPGSGSRRPCTC